MNVWIVDTSSWISYFRGEPQEGLDLALKEARVYLPPLVTAELLSAQLKPAERKGLIDFLKELPLCDASFDHWLRVGELRSRCLARGLGVSTPDAHIVQCCLDSEGYLLSEDEIFKKVAKIFSIKQI